MAHEGWGQQLHSMENPQHRQSAHHIWKAGAVGGTWSKGWLFINCGKAQQCSKGRYSLFYAGRYMSIYIINGMVYRHTYVDLFNQTSINYYNHTQM